MKILRRIERAERAALRVGLQPLAGPSGTAVAELAERLGPGRMSGFIILDPSADGMPAALRHADPRRVTRIEHERFVGAAIALLELGDFDDPLLALSVQSAQASARAHQDGAVCGWVFGRADGRQMIRGLGHAIDYVVRGARVRHMLLAHRARRALHLPSLLEAAQWAMVRRHLADWAVIDWQGALVWLPPPLPTSAVAGTRLHLDASRHSRIQRLDEVNAVLDAIVRTGARVDAGTAARVDPLIARFDGEYASGYTHDRILFAAHGLHVHAEFDRHPDVAAALRGARGAFGVAAALNRFDTAAWSRIRDDLDGSHAHSAPPQGRSA